MAKQALTYEPQVLDLTLYAGDGTEFRLVVKDSSNVAIPLTGTMRAQIRESRSSPNPPSAVFNIDLSDGDDGIAILSLTGEQTQALAPSSSFSGVWDLEWTATGAEPVTLLQGKVECNPDVSH